jgi:small subunit ribosomal protein S16
MAVRIRLRRMGRKKHPHYRVVVADSAKPRDGRFVENLGYYRPLVQPARLVLDLERVDYWIGQGAQPSETVRSLVVKARKGGDDTVALGEVDSDELKASRAEDLAARRKAEEDKRKAEAEAVKAEAAEAEARATAEAEAKATAAAEAEAGAAADAEAVEPDEAPAAEAEEAPAAEAEDAPAADEPESAEADSDEVKPEG